MNPAVSSNHSQCAGALESRKRRSSVSPVAILAVVFLALAPWGCNEKEPTLRDDAASSAASEQPAPNILLVTFDTTRADHLGCYGHKGARTPVIDRLAKEGVRFTRCYAPVPLTLPSHASIMTGVYPQRHGLRINSGSLADEFECLAERLKDKGFATGAVIGARVLSTRRHLDQGFDFYDQDFGDSAVTTKYHIVERRADAVSRVAVDWLDARGERPWFLWVHYFDPHANYEAPGTPADIEKSAAYDLEIAYADSQLGRVVRKAEDSSRSRRRALSIVLTADHGESLGDHGEFTHGIFTYDATIHVPLILKSPEPGYAGRNVETAVSTVDIYPTILQWAGLTPSYEVDGEVLNLEGADDSRPQRRPIYFESLGSNIWYGWSPLRGVVVGRWKYIEAPQRELYDLIADPRELTNLYGSDQTREVALSDALTWVEDATSIGPGWSPSGEVPRPDAAEARELAALGYVGATSERENRRDKAIDPKDMIEVHVGLFEARRQIVLGDLDRAQSALATALMHDPSNQVVLEELSQFLDHQGRTKEVASIIRRAVTGLPSSCPTSLPFTVLGIAEARVGNLEQAEKWLRHALTINERDGEALYNLGEVLLLRGDDPKDAEPFLRAAFEGDSTNEQFADGLVRLYQRANEPVRALEVYVKLTDLDRSNGRAHYKTAVLLCRMGQNEQCAERVAQSLSLAGESRAAWVREARALLGRLKAAE